MERAAEPTVANEALRATNLVKLFNLGSAHFFDGRMPRAHLGGGAACRGVGDGR